MGNPNLHAPVFLETARRNTWFNFADLAEGTTLLVARLDSVRGEVDVSMSKEMFKTESRNEWKASQEHQGSALEITSDNIIRESACMAYNNFFFHS